MTLRSTSLPVIATAPYRMGDVTAQICVTHGKGGYGAWLKYPNGKELPLSTGRAQTVQETIANARRFLGGVIGKRN